MTTFLANVLYTNPIMVMGHHRDKDVQIISLGSNLMTPILTDGCRVWETHASLTNSRMIPANLGHKAAMNSLLNPSSLGVLSLGRCLRA